uniref:Ig-like domain-containing protein n=1 Tax=Crocodylus porosus TaxID=8502 RepID=A0A7M4ERI5_CROPO
MSACFRLQLQVSGFPCILLFILQELSSSVRTFLINNKSCNFTLPLDILQITWQKRKGYSFENIATSSKRHRPKSVGLFQNRVLFTNTSLNASSITLCNVTLQDEGDYKCLFNAFPHGSFSRNTHLTVQAVSEIRTELHVNFINEGILTAICSATGKPAPKITWRPEGVLTAHHPEVGSVHNADGTVTVTNACNFTLERLKSLTCKVIVPVLLALVRLHLTYCVQFRALHRYVELVVKVLKRRNTVPFKYLKGCHKLEGKHLMSLAAESRTWTSDLKLQQSRFKWDVRKNFFIVGNGGLGFNDLSG